MLALNASLSAVTVLGLLTPLPSDLHPLIYSSVISCIHSTMQFLRLFVRLVDHPFVSCLHVDVHLYVHSLCYFP